MRTRQSAKSYLDVPGPGGPKVKRTLLEPVTVTARAIPNDIHEAVEMTGRRVRRAIEKKLGGNKSSY
jgi:hypothetical protein